MDCHKLLAFYPFRAVSATLFHSFMRENTITICSFLSLSLGNLWRNVMTRIDATIISQKNLCVISVYGLFRFFMKMSYLECTKNNKIRKTSSSTDSPDLYFRYSFTLFLTACPLCTSDWKALVILTKEFFLLFLHHFPLDMH